MITLEAKGHEWRGYHIVSRYDGWCLSTDEKPVEGVMNGSCLIEMDTGKVYFFDEAGKAWTEFAETEGA